MTRFRALAAGVMAFAAIVVGDHGNARAEISGWLPEPGEFGVASVVYSGGDLDGLIAEGASAGCRIGTVWTLADAKFLVYSPDLPAFVNAEFLRVFPDGMIPGPTALLLTCEPENSSPSSPQSTPAIGDRLPEHPTGLAPVSTPAAGQSALRLECGGALFVIDNWRIPQYLTDSVQMVYVDVSYRLPANTTSYEINVVLDTQAGWVPSSRVRDVVTDPDVERALHLDGGTWATYMNGNFLASWAGNPEYVNWGVADGKLHRKTFSFQLQTADLYDNGWPHRSRVPGWRLSMLPEVGLPFRVQETPDLHGTFTAGGREYSIMSSPRWHEQFGRGTCESETLLFPVDRGDEADLPTVGMAGWRIVNSWGRASGHPAEYTSAETEYFTITGGEWHILVEASNTPGTFELYLRREGGPRTRLTDYGPARSPYVVFEPGLGPGRYRLEIEASQVGWSAIVQERVP